MRMVQMKLPPRESWTGWLIATVIVAVIGAFATPLGPMVLNYLDLLGGWVTPVYSTALRGDRDVMRGEDAILELAGLDRGTNSKTVLEGYECAADAMLPGGKKFPSGLVALSRSPPCVVTLTNAPALFSAETPGPLPMTVTLSGLDQRGRSFSAPVQVLVLHDLKRPAPDFPRGRTVAAGGALPVRIQLESGHETARAISCEWYPPNNVVVSEDTCSATFVAPQEVEALDKAPIDVWARVTIAAKGQTFEVRSEQAAVTVFPAAVSNAGPALPAPPHQPAPPAPSLRMSVDALVSLVGSADEMDRYAVLQGGLARLDPAMTLTVFDVLALLGPLRGTFRRDLIANALLPRMAHPLAPEDVVRLFAGLSSFDRTDLLRQVAPCIARPIGGEEQQRLLAGVVAGLRSGLAGDLAADGACSKS